MQDMRPSKKVSATPNVEHRSFPPSSQELYLEFPVILVLSIKISQMEGRRPPDPKVTMNSLNISFRFLVFCAQDNVQSPRWALSLRSDFSSQG